LLSLFLFEFGSDFVLDPRKVQHKFSLPVTDASLWSI
jgi:hypothetical protein